MDLFDHINSTTQYLNESEEEEDYDRVYDELISTTTKALNILKEQKTFNNIQWIKSIKKNFNSVNKMVDEIEQYQQKRMMPLTWKEHTHNTRYLNM
ncbi:15829_t:CDS:1, partial [Racocetra persica]